MCALYEHGNPESDRRLKRSINGKWQESTLIHNLTGGENRYWGFELASGVAGQRQQRRVTIAVGACRQSNVSLDSGSRAAARLNHRCWGSSLGRRRQPTYGMHPVSTPPVQSSAPSLRHSLAYESRRGGQTHPCVLQSGPSAPARAAGGPARPGDARRGAGRATRAAA